MSEYLKYPPSRLNQTSATRYCQYYSYPLASPIDIIIDVTTHSSRHSSVEMSKEEAWSFTHCSKPDAKLSSSKKYLATWREKGRNDGIHNGVVF